jgi:hypothetical protein
MNPPPATGAKGNAWTIAAEEWFPTALNRLMAEADFYAGTFAMHKRNPDKVPAAQVAEARAQLHAVMVTALLTGRRHSDPIPKE